jgi:pyruvate,water dikinase
VLVCRTTSPAWTPLLARARAVVTEIGGMLAHAAIVAREFGIPAVVAAPGAMTTLADGQRVVVDGGAGTVTAATGETSSR